MTNLPLENRLRFKHLALLRALHADGSLHKAAPRLHMSQPGASKLLRELESLFGTPLFMRGASGLTATPACLLLLEHAQAVLLEVDVARSEIAASGSVNPIARVGANSSAVHIHLVPLMSKFHEVHRSAQIRIVEGQTDSLLEMLRQGQIDMALALLAASALREGQLRGISHRMVSPGDWVFVANRSHPLARKREISARDLEPCRWALSPPGSLTRAAFEQAFYSAGLLPPRPCIEAVPFATMLSIARSSDVLTVAPRAAVVAPESGGGLAILQTAELKINVPPMAVFYKQAALKRAHLRTMLDLLDGTSAAMAA
ncbi:HTH-type transcriptional regulator GbpR [Cupriavidus laharis]|uniref:HTH-type transcriptional regulator GbpR n=1 Tax=Cupriavidus laharis TaxID=151654 RepID=A0ABM8WNT9_9BURK|nr:LysR substrate-binding domain-containing protein [Cupriavidus laharis]CAG9169094.1 HTH-type transcriptional regulator GbpR [Cupriavidus laharis]